MNITEILTISFEDSETVYVEAIAEDYALIHHQTLYDPPEYGPAKVSTFIKLDEIQDYQSDIGLKIPLEYPMDAVKEYMEAVDYDLNWIEIKDDY
jgi:hypothetical protein